MIEKDKETLPVDWGTFPSKNGQPWETRGNGTVLAFNEEDVAWVNRWCYAIAVRMSNNRTIGCLTFKEVHEFLLENSRRCAEANSLFYRHNHFDTTIGTTSTLHRGVDHVGFSADLATEAFDYLLNRVGHNVSPSNTE